MSEIREAIQQVIRQVNQVVLGKEEQIREIMTAFLAGGHVLLTDVPGVGKTTMALAFAKTLNLKYNRVQMTPDVLPSDLTGFSVYRKERETFVYEPGSVFCNLLLADEVNRTSPKTQSALLEVMEEGKVTAEGVTRPVPQPFLVVATQNPLGSAGTQPLPESQIDRFMVGLSMGYPDFESEVAMAKGISARRAVDGVQPVLDGEGLLKAQEEAAAVYLHDDLARYIVELVQAARTHPQLSQGISPRATIALVKTAKAAAWLSGRDYVIPRDVTEQFPYVMEHRMVLSRQAKLEGVPAADLCSEILSSVKKPSMGA